MPKVFLATILLFAGLLAATAPAYAQESHVVGESELHDAVVDRASGEEAQREAIQSLLRRPEVRELARLHQLDIARAENAVGQLQGPDLSRLAAQATQANAQLSGGDNIVIGTTTLIIILLILIILLLL